MNAARDFSALIVDDSPFQRSLLTSLVRAAGAGRVHLAKTPAEGFQALRDAEPDLVVMDYEIAPGGALEFCRAMRRDDSLPNRGVPVIVVAATPTRGGIEGLRAMGVNAVLAKPCSPLAMKEKVTALFADPRPFIVSADYVGPCRRRRQDPAYRGPLRRMSDPEAEASPARRLSPARSDPGGD
jgi:CheY-like chemotaxis protein